MTWFNEAIEIFRTNLIDLWSTDWASVQFKKEYFASRAAGLLFAALLFKILWPLWRGRKERSFYEHSGYIITAGDKPGLMGKILGKAAIFFVLAGVVFTFIAIADPYLIITNKTEFIKSRQIVYLKDVSVSMGFKFKTGKVSRAEIVHDFLLNLIAARKDKQDRSAFFTYATSPYLSCDFTVKPASFLFCVDSAPKVVADPETPKVYREKFVIKEFMKVPFGGASDLILGLEAVNKLFDKKDKESIRGSSGNYQPTARSVILITDGASARDPEPEFKELRRRHIVPYLVYIDPDKEMEQQIHGESSPETKLSQELLKLVRKYGGDYFIATDKWTLDKIAGRLDQLHAVQTGVKRNTSEKHIYRLPLMAGLLSFVLAVIARLILYRLHRVV